MSKVGLGKVSILPRGEWSYSNSYKRLDLVTYQNASYLAVQDIPANTSQINNTNNWQKVISISNLINDSAGQGITDKVWSANKLYTEFLSLKNRVTQLENKIN